MRENKMTKRCVALRNGIPCNSTKNVIEHHLSYDPPISVYICQKCHSLVHWSDDPARHVTWNEIFGKGDPLSNALILKGRLIATRGIHNKFYCWACLLDGTQNKFENEREFAEHFFQEHFKNGMWKSLPVWTEGVNYKDKF